MEVHPFLGLDQNRALEDHEVDRCIAVARALQRSAQTGGGMEEDHSQWIAPGGHRVYGHVSGIGFQSVSRRFLNRLRLESYIFSGYWLTNLTGDTHHPHWNDGFGAFFEVDPASAHLDWSVAAFKQMTAGVPEPYICSPPLVMGEIGYQVGPHCVNRDVVAYQERINLMREAGLFEPLARKKVPVILEIGAGYGALAYYIKKILPQSVYIVVDLPRSLIFSSCYLAATLPGQKVEVFDGDRLSLESATVVIVPNRVLSRIGEVGIDLAINTLSFAEMSSDVVHGYADFIRQHLVQDGAFYEQNFDNVHYGEAHFCNPKEILVHYFSSVQIPRSRALWGQPRIWRAPRPFSPK